MERSTKKLYEADVAGMKTAYYMVEGRFTFDTGSLTRYGVLIRRADGDEAEFPDVFGSALQARQFIRRLYRHKVTPATLGDIVYDHLCREDIRV